MFNLKLKDAKICIIGLGYIGLPLFIELSKKFEVIGYDINKKRVSELLEGVDKNNQIKRNNIKKYKNKIFFKSTIKFNEINTFIVTVPTPIFKNKNPNLKMLSDSSKFISKYISKGNIVIFESTVYPGVVEEVCAPIIEKESSLIFNKDFYCGYSPERINPGDTLNTINKINKIISASNKKCIKYMYGIYSSFLLSKIHIADSIKIAEASKVIENTQRDINIAFINEITILFDKMGIDTNKILRAANTKWNFLDFKPGLVGGHCIGVDPYYLSYAASKLGYNPKIINSGRQINDYMGKFVCKKINQTLLKKQIVLKKTKILFFGLTFKENCPDIRNSKVFDIIDYYYSKTNEIYLFDPLLKKNDLQKKYASKFITKFKKNYYDVIVISVAHKYFKKLKYNEYLSLCKKNHIIFDIKNILFKYPDVFRL